MFILPNFGNTTVGFFPLPVSKSLYIGDGVNNPINDGIAFSGYTSLYFYNFSQATPNDDLVPLLYNVITKEVIPSTPRGRVFAGTATTIASGGTAVVSISALSLAVVPFVTATAVNTSTIFTVTCNITAVTTTSISFRLFRSTNVTALGGNPVTVANSTTFHYFVYY
jgi:hypothetical protein